jgi:hypothetical protein
VLGVVGFATVPAFTSNVLGSAGTRGDNILAYLGARSVDPDLSRRAPSAAEHPQPPSTLRSHGALGTIDALAITASGASSENPWKPPGHTCSSAWTPACHSRVA